MLLEMINEKNPPSHLLKAKMVRGNKTKQKPKNKTQTLLPAEVTC